MRINRQKIVLSILMALVVGAIGGWQYLKFTNKHGLYYYLGPDRGGYALLVALVCMAAFGLYMVWTDDNAE